MENIWELRICSEEDDIELGLRVSAALWAENNSLGVSRYEMICFRGYEATRQRRKGNKP